MAAVLEIPVGAAVTARAILALPASCCATFSAEKAVTQNKLNNAAEVANIRAAFRFHECIVISFCHLSLLVLRTNRFRCFVIGFLSLWIDIIYKHLSQSIGRYAYIH